MPRWLYALLIFTGAAFVLDVLRISVPPLVLFVIAGLGILPLAALIGQSVERVAEHTGERIGGLLFATFGNATELIIGIFALTQGLIDVVQASIIGSILGNALLVLGVSVVIGSVKNGRLQFEVRPASQYASLLTLCVGGLMLPKVAELFASHGNLFSATQINQQSLVLSEFIAVVLLLGYIASILFSVFRLGDQTADDGFDPMLGARSTEAITRLLSYRHHLAQSSHSGKSGVLHQIDDTLQAIVAHESSQGTPAVPTTQKVLPEASAHPEDTGGVAQATGPKEVAANKQDAATQRSFQPTILPEAKRSEVEKKSSESEKKPNLWLALLVLTAATGVVAVLSNILVGTIEPFTELLHWKPAFVGLVFIPLIGNITEYFNTISMALNKRMGLVLAASAGSSIQVALLMAPILVLLSIFTVHQLDLRFSIIELGVLALATFLFSEITKDGELVWLEGLLLILLYMMMGGTVFLFGS